MSLSPLRLTNLTSQGQCAALNKWADGVNAALLASTAQIAYVNQSGGAGSAHGAGIVLPFSELTSGVAVNENFTVGGGASLLASGTGVIEATELATNGVPVVVNGNAPVHAGQLLISQPGNTTAVWADPLVQGLFPPGTNVTSGGTAGAPINPVLVGAQNPSTLLENLNVDASGNLLVLIKNLGQQLAAASIPIVLTAIQTTALTPPTASAIGTAVATDLLKGTQLAAASVPVALPTATITTLTPVTAAAIAAAIVANPPAIGGGTQYATGAATATPTGTVAMGFDGTDVWALPLDATTHYLQVDIKAGGSGGGAVTNAGIFAVQDTVLDACVTSHILAVHDASPASQAVTNTGTFAVQATLAAETTKVIGTVNQGTSPWIISGAVTLASTTITGSVAVTGTFYQATQPVSGTIAFSNTSLAVTNTGTFAVQATLSAETTKVIGTVNQGTSPWVTKDTILDGCVTSNVLAVSLPSATVSTLTPVTAAAIASAIVSNPPTTIAVTQGTAANLNAKVIGTGTFVVQDSVLDACIASNIVAVHDASPVSQAVTNAGTFAVQAQDVSGGFASSGQISVLVTATEIVILRATRNAVKITNTTGTYPVWIGFTSGVTASTGDLLPAVAGAFVIIPSQTTVYGIAVGGTQIVSFLDVWN
jgi:hypothetical protein